MEAVCAQLWNGLLLPSLCEYSLMILLSVHSWVCACFMYISYICLHLLAQPNVCTIRYHEERILAGEMAYVTARLEEAFFNFMSETMPRQHLFAWGRVLRARFDLGE